MMSTERTMLIVDDDVDYVEAISVLLEANDFTVPAAPISPRTTTCTLWRVEVYQPIRYPTTRS
jgi:hypothetical protein